MNSETSVRNERIFCALVYASTLAPGKEEQVLGPKRVWSAIPKGKPDDARGDDAGLSEMKNADSHDMHDRCFTTRKTPTGPTSKF